MLVKNLTIIVCLIYKYIGRHSLGEKIGMGHRTGGMMANSYKILQFSCVFF